MAAKKKKKNNKKKLSQYSNFLWGFIGISLICFLFYFLYTKIASLFIDNERLVVNKVEVQGDTYWTTRSKTLIKLLDIKLGATNIFNLDLSDLRAIILKQPTVKDVEVYRELPDTIKIKILSRMPEAIVVISSNNWFPIDDEGIILPRNSTKGYTNELPQLRKYDFNIKLQNGNKIPQIDFTLNILAKFKDTKFTQFELNGTESYLEISKITNSSNYLFLTIVINNLKLKKPFTVILDKNNKDVDKRLVKLKEVVTDILLKNGKEREIKLIYDGLIPVK